MKRLRMLTAIVAQVALVAAFTLGGAHAKSNGGRDGIKVEDLREWLTYLSSDDLEGRNTYTEGLGLAAGFIAAQLKSWGIKPGGPNGSYFQRVPVQGIKVDNHSTIIAEVNGQTRTFKNGEGVRFPTNPGGKQSLTASEIEFMGYGLSAPDAGHDDYAGRNVKSKVVVFLGASGPSGLPPQYRRSLFSRGGFATGLPGAVASIGPPRATGQGGPGRGDGAPPAATGQQGEQPDFTTVERLDKPVPPQVSAQDDFFDFLFSGADVKYAELKEKAAKGEPLTKVSLKNVRLTFNVDAEYRVLRTQFTRNVIGIIEGTDAKLKDTYVAFGAHYDHVGYAEAEVVKTDTGSRRMGRSPGRITEGAIEDRIWNGADDDGSGTVSILAIAKAFATGTKPRRSLLFVWHAGEEKGLLGSRHFADFPTVPIDKIVAQVNIDMIGRNDKNDPAKGNSVFVVGSDRISTELHNVSIDANASFGKPLDLDFAMNDPTDPEQIYYRSDHFSYAAKGIPIIFLYTGTHPDYHANTDSVEKILFDKMARIAQFAYEVGARVGNLDHAPVRDNKGPRVGKGSSGKL